MSTKLDQLYSLRKNFTIIGLTGRTGSGCTELSEILSKDINSLDDLRKPDELPISIFQRKYKTVYDYCKYPNWKKYKIIQYKRVLMLILLPELLKNENKHETLLHDFFRDRLKNEPDKLIINKIRRKIRKIINSNSVLLERIQSLGDISKIKTKKNLVELNNIFWNEDGFNSMAEEIDKILIENGLTKRIMLLHHVANNFRKSKQPFKTNISDPKNIYYIAEVINRIIKASSKTPGDCHIVIDSLRNSLEVNFFKERFSAFYLVAVKNDKRKSRLIEKKKDLTLEEIDRILEMDEMEYDPSDFQIGEFFAPDVQNCIQIADYHINNNHSKEKIKKNEENINDFEKSFFSFSEQLLKLQALIQQPGIITPNPQERVMQIAYTAKLNSGCISRQVGAVVTNEEFSIKAVGWNDVPKGAVPCSIRNVKELINPNEAFGFTKFEIGQGLKETEQINAHDDKSEIDKESNDFHAFIIENYNESKFPSEKLGGRNCPYCFKQAYNAFSGEKNQVHTRSLHAEENAILQISKDGGQQLKNGNLFTTASPCELCAKKAYQLGIRNIYFIDPYPGISRNHILKSNEKTDPKMILFSGAVGRAYHKLYEPFLSQKDELAMLANHKIESPSKIKAKQLRNLLSKNFKGKEELKNKLDNLFEDDDLVFEKIIQLLEKGLSID